MSTVAKTSYSEKLQAAMEVKTQAEADALFEELVSLCCENGEPRAKCEVIQRSNLGYFAGYYDSETRARVERLFKCAHPIFGPIAQKGEPSPEEAFKMGQQMGESLKKKGRK